MTVFKYRDLHNFERIYDIVANKQVHCSTYSKLNDPFEGEYVHYFGSSESGIGESGLEESGNNGENYKYVEESKYKICSFSLENDNVVMWSSYADEHKGVCIEIELLEYSEEELIKITYDIDHKKVTKEHLSERTIRRVLSKKSKPWEYEKEIRLFSNDEKHRIKGRVNSIILGCRTSRNEEMIIRAIAPEVKIKRAKVGFDYKMSIEEI